jgi:hypothetical protein
MDVSRTRARLEGSFAVPGVPSVDEVTQRSSAAEDVLRGGGPAQQDDTAARQSDLRDREAADKASAPHASHYRGGKVEPIDLIESQELPFHLANVVKYVTRAHYYWRPLPMSVGNKKEISKALDKAEWYLKRWREIAGL